MKLPIRILLPTLLLALATPCLAEPALVILVRHAERAAEPADDPVLTASGSARAEALADALEASGIDAIIVTQFARTQQTAAPLAARLGLTPQIVEARTGGRDEHLAAVVDAVRAQDGVVLVVGHSNTLMPIVAALGGPTLPDLEDWEFSNLLLLLPEDGMRLERRRYGAPDTAP
jgi:broad specificity phosphatase PhoE